MAERRPLAARQVTAGDLVALPILATPDGMPFDLEEAADGGPAILLFMPDSLAETLRGLEGVATRLAAAPAHLFVIVPQALTVSDAAGWLLDRDGGFAYTLGLAEWSHRRSGARLARPVGVVIDAVGKVVAVEAGGGHGVDLLIDGLAAAAASSATGIVYGQS